MQLLHEIVLLFETTSKRLVLSTCKVNLLTCNVEEIFCLKPYLDYQLEIKIEELKSIGLLSNCKEQNLR